MWMSRDGGMEGGKERSEGRREASVTWCCRRRCCSFQTSNKVWLSRSVSSPFSSPSLVLVFLFPDASGSPLPPLIPPLHLLHPLFFYSIYSLSLSPHCPFSSSFLFHPLLFLIFFLLLLFLLVFLLPLILLILVHTPQSRLRHIIINCLTPRLASDIYLLSQPVM